MNETTTASSQDEPKNLERTCPACGGFLIRLDGNFRCSRCRISICESCEGGMDSEDN